MGTIATMVTRSMPGLLLGVFVVAGTLAAALAVRPSAGRVILPVPVLAYLVAALVSGVVYDRTVTSSSTALAIGAAQWVASGFFAMVLATVLAVGIVAARWYLWRRSRPVSRQPGWAVPAATGPTPTRAGTGPAATMGPAATGPRAAQPRPPQAAWPDPAEAGYPADPAEAGYPGGPGRTGETQVMGGTRRAGDTQATERPGRNAAAGRNSAPGRGAPAGPRGSGQAPADPRSRPRPGSEPYNFSSGA